VKHAAVLRALSDERRLEILDKAVASPGITLGKLTTGIVGTRQACRKHVQVLASAGLIRLEPTGREVRVFAESARVQSAANELADIAARWEDRLARLRDYVEKSTKDVSFSHGSIAATTRNLE
jgi:DNA-binding transcriptional ArsR family regulator